MKKFIVIENCIHFGTIENMETKVFDTENQARECAIQMANDTMLLLNTHIVGTYYECRNGKSVYLIEKDDTQNERVHTVYVILPIEI